MEKNKLEESLKALLGGVLSGVQEENIRKYQSLMDDVIRDSGNIDLKDFENFDIMVKYQLEKALEVMVYKLNPEVDDSRKMNDLIVVYNNYGFISRNLEAIIRQKEGSACSVDKSRWLIRCYREYIVNEVIPDMTIDEKCYWKPQFGSGQLWMNFIKALVALNYGYPEDYLLCLKQLLPI